MSKKFRLDEEDYVIPNNELEIKVPEQPKENPTTKKSNETKKVPPAQKNKAKQQNAITKKTTNNNENNEYDLVEIFNTTTMCEIRTSIALTPQQQKAIDAIALICNIKGKRTGLIREAVSQYCEKLKKKEPEKYSLIVQYLKTTK